MFLFLFFLYVDPCYLAVGVQFAAVAVDFFLLTALVVLVVALVVVVAVAIHVMLLWWFSVVFLPPHSRPGHFPSAHASLWVSTPRWAVHQVRLTVCLLPSRLSFSPSFLLSFSPSFLLSFSPPFLLSFSPSFHVSRLSPLLLFPRLDLLSSRAPSRFSPQRMQVETSH